MTQQKPSEAINYLKSGATYFIIGSVLLLISFLPFISYILISPLISPITSPPPLLHSTIPHTILPILFTLMNLRPYSFIIAWVSLFGFERWYSRTEKGLKMLRLPGYNVGLGILGSLLMEIGLYVWVFLTGVSFLVFLANYNIYSSSNFSNMIFWFSDGGLIIAIIGSIFIAIIYARLGDVFRDSLTKVGGWLAFSALTFNLIYDVVRFFIFSNITYQEYLKIAPDIAALDILSGIILVVPFVLVYLGFRKAEKLTIYGQVQIPQYSVSPEIEGLKKLRTANIIMIIAAITASWLYVLLFSELSLAGLAGVSSIVGTIVAIVASGLTVGQVAMLMMMRGFGDLKSLYPKLGIGRTGSIITYVGFILFIFFFIIAELLAAWTYIISFIGYVLLGIGFYRIGNTYNSGIVKAGGILFIFIPVIGHIKHNRTSQHNREAHEGFTRLAHL
ncbi:DUF973 family protein [Vulcanisaeta sp. JCM 14467]|uniref:DUF973 family protein n=1 Tax=Vulcanisaeta sp. JCM 14467 TaxID=1295370 RepID=UPI0006D22B35|nr:DUF973 family protein [Vulcanisaeta sp. JCM 14467]